MPAQRETLGALSNTSEQNSVNHPAHDLNSQYGGVVDGVAAMFGRHCCVALYSLSESHWSLLKHSGEGPNNPTLGTPMPDFLLQKLTELQQQGRHSLTTFSYSSLGAPTKISVQRLCDAQGATIGLLSISLCLAAPLHELMADLMPKPQISKQAEVSPENFNNNVEQLVTLTVERTIEGINASGAVANNLKNKYIVTTLYEKGIFDIKDAIAMVSNKLNISKHTVYLYIRQKKRDDEELLPPNPETS